MKKTLRALAFLAPAVVAVTLFVYTWLHRDRMYWCEVHGSYYVILALFVSWIGFPTRPCCRFLRIASIQISCLSRWTKNKHRARVS